MHNSGLQLSTLWENSNWPFPLSPLEVSELWRLNPLLSLKNVCELVSISSSLCVSRFVCSRTFLICFLDEIEKQRRITSLVLGDLGPGAHNTKTWGNANSLMKRAIKLKNGITRVNFLSPNLFWLLEGRAPFSAKLGYRFPDSHTWPRCFPVIQALGPKLEMCTIQIV